MLFRSRAYETARRLYCAGKFDAIADSEILNASRIRIARLEIMDFYEGPASSFGVISSDNVREPDAVSVQDCCATTDAAIDTQVRQGFSDKAEKTEEDSGSFQELQTATDAAISPSLPQACHWVRAVTDTEAAMPRLLQHRPELHDRDRKSIV